jgi:hypothetical protein
MADDAPFARHKDIDIHLILEAGSPLLQQEGPVPIIVEEEADGLAIEAGPKPVEQYASPEAVLANPEIAHHLTVDSILYDPDGLLSSLQHEVRKHYADRKWVEARVNHERDGFEGALAMRPMAAAMLGPSAEVNLLGYSHTFLSAALAVARLQAPNVGGRSFVRLRQHLTDAGRIDLYDRVLEILGLATFTTQQASRFVDEGAELFDIAVVSRKTPHFFQHKFHVHLRPYFVDSCREMIAEGYHREAAGWATPFLLASSDIIRVDGPDQVRSLAAERQKQLLEDFGMATSEALDQRFEQMAALGEEIFALAGEIVRDNRAVVA